jgi:hypothetical protein
VPPQGAYTHDAQHLLLHLFVSVQAFRKQVACASNIELIINIIHQAVNLALGVLVSSHHCSYLISQIRFILKCFMPCLATQSKGGYAKDRRPLSGFSVTSIRSLKTPHDDKFIYEFLKAKCILSLPKYE